LSGCARSTPTRYYLLESALEPVKADTLPSKNLRVAQVTVPDYLDRNSIVSRVNGETELVVSQFHAWAEPVGHGVRRVVQEVLTPPLLAVGLNVLAPGDDTRADYALLVDLQRLDGNFDSKAVLEARWTLKNRHDDVIARGIYADAEPVAGKTYDVLTAAESRMVRRMGEHLAARLPVLTRGKS
jgi:uncharacterized lipoprotein YmbA